ncbi:MAG: lysophospholipid acyltransferase family protein [Eubacteriales bacterium]|nr:lysophospholipid acyltransferase family protein [Eubacteriales bacterium]
MNKKISKEILEPRPFWARGAFRLALNLAKAWANLEYHGLENLPENGGFVIAANHQCYLDGLFILGALNKEQFSRSTALAGADLSTSHGFLGKLIMKIGRPIAVERYGNPIRGLIAAKRALQAGQIVLVHPEGTRTSTGYLATLQSGAAYLSIKAKVPLVPVYISGAYDCFPRQAKRPHYKIPRTGKRAKIRLHFLEPMIASDYANAQQFTEALTKTLYDAETRWLDSPEGRTASVVDEAQDWTRASRPSLNSLLVKKDEA